MPSRLRAKTRRSRNKSRRTRRRQRGGGLKEEATAVMTAFARTKGMSLENVHLHMLNLDYNKRRNPNYDTKGFSNPMMLDNFVFRAIGHRASALQARYKLNSDDNDAMDRMAEQGKDENTLIDRENNDKYVAIFSHYD